MSLKSSTVALTGSPVLLVSATGGSATCPKKVSIVPSAAITIGGADAQTFPVTASGVTLELVSGDDVWGTGTATVQVLEVNV